MELKRIVLNIQQQLPDTLKNIGKEEYDTEIRLHPLLKWHWAAVSTARAAYKPYKVPEGLIKDLMTPRVHYFTEPEKYTPSDLVYGRIQRNEAVIFPNLWSWTKMAICRITEAESIFLKDIKIEQLHDAFIGSQEFFRIYDENKESGEKIYPSVNMNFLRPSASSVLQPHFQLLITPIPNPLLGMSLHFSEEYYSENHSNFYLDYIKCEKENDERWIGETGVDENKFSWMTAWCPIAGSDEVIFISHNYSSFPLSDDAWQSIAEGLHKIFVGYHETGIRSINMILVSDVWDTYSENFRVFGLIWSRPLRNLDVSDRGFAEIGFKIALTYRSPEKCASELKKHW